VNKLLSTMTARFDRAVKKSDTRALPRDKSRLPGNTRAARRRILMTLAY
jgi:hypothetical protein